MYGSYITCGGSLITEQWVLSAAHCFKQDPDPSNYMIYLGKYQISVSGTSEKSSSVKKIVINPQYTSTASRGDIALIKLSKPVTYTKYIMPICLPAGYLPFPSGMECWVTGWGDIASDVSLPKPRTLQKVKMPLIGYKQCDQMYHIGSSTSSSITIIQEEKICAGYKEGGKDSCQGDSGGPLVCKVDGVWIQAGVVSWGEGCAKKNRPGVYTLVPAYESWINRTVNTGITFTSARWGTFIFCVLIFTQV